MQFERIASPSLKDLFVQQLERMILSGSCRRATASPPSAIWPSKWA